MEMQMYVDNMMHGIKYIYGYIKGKVMDVIATDTWHDNRHILSMRVYIGYTMFYFVIGIFL